MRLSAYVPVYTAALTLSAFLLFVVQPLYGKMVLPLLGGSPAVWNTAMLFFQIALLAGYAYAHVGARLLDPRAQAVLHIALFFVFAVLLPPAIPDGWLFDPDRDHPALWQLGVMALTIGGPFFVLSGTAPMLQKWFSHTPHPEAHDPYFLYAASNLGSMSALLAYPVVIEPLMALHTQALAWTGGYGGLVVLIGLCAILFWGPRTRTVGGRDAPTQARPAETITWSRRGLWMLLAFVPSSLMLGVTFHVTTDIAAVPLMWVIPLALYLGTFILAFARKQRVSYKYALYMQTFGLALVIIWSMSHAGLMVYFLFFAHLLLFFATALICHMDLARQRPSAHHLTEFFLFVSIGGALGGLFNALLAPVLFPAPFEYPLIIGLAVTLRFINEPGSGLRARWGSLSNTGLRATVVLLAAVAVAAGISVATDTPRPAHFVAVSLAAAALLLLQRRRWSYAIAASMALLYSTPLVYGLTDSSLLMERNFFGVVRVLDRPVSGKRVLMHGTTVHGVQPLAEAYKTVPLSYFHPNGPIGAVFAHLDDRDGPQAIAVLGLGAGTVACYAKMGRHFDFYEIDPDMIRIAQDPALFTYLSGCDSEYNIIAGDGRITLARAPEQHYDLVFVDAFSSDSVPMHLITAEAFELYRSKLKPGGLIAVNLSNRYLDLRPEVAAIARTLGLSVSHKQDGGGTHPGTDLVYVASRFAVLSSNPEIMAAFDADGWTRAESDPALRPWSDDYANILRAFGVGERPTRGVEEN